MIYNLDLQINENVYETYNNGNNYIKNFVNNSTDKDINYKEIDNIEFAPIIKKENEFLFFRKNFEIFKMENNDKFYNYYNNLSDEKKKIFILGNL